MLLTILASATIILLIATVAILLIQLSGLNNKLDDLEDKYTGFASKQDTLSVLQEKQEKAFREEIAKNREELATSVKSSSESISTHMRDLSKLQNEQLNSFASRLQEFGQATHKQLQNMNESSRHDLGQMKQSVETNIKSLQEDNSKKLEEMRTTVDEKLQTTLEKRISASFQLVSERLEQVHKGLGEMQNLASGVGDLKKVLTNVKMRGTWGEIQLQNLLEQVLSPEQYEANVATKKNTTERVDFAIKLPGDSDSGEPVWLPIDAKFPQEDYHKLIEAQETSNTELFDLARKQLEARIKLEAKTIRDKYLNPPYTTDFGLLFLPIEGLYAEVIRNPELIERLQRDYRVNVVGPTTFGALLNSLQMGFRTLTIQKRSSDVWKLLADIKKHFGSFGDLLGKAHDKVQQAAKVIEDAGRRSRTIETKLKKVQELPGSGGAEDLQEGLLSQVQNN